MVQSSPVEETIVSKEAALFENFDGRLIAQSQESYADQLRAAPSYLSPYQSKK